MHCKSKEMIFLCPKCKDLYEGSDIEENEDGDQLCPHCHDCSVLEVDKFFVDCDKCGDTVPQDGSLNSDNSIMVFLKVL